MAKIYLDSTNTEYAISNNNDDVVGLAGTQAIRVASNVNGVIVDQNVEKVAFAGNASDYTFLHNGNSIKVYNAAASTLVSTIFVQGDADGTQLTFANGSANAILSGGVLKLGGATVDSSAAVHVTPTLDTTGITPPAVSSLNLTLGQDEISGTNGNDTFVARLVNNANTLQSGDVVHGGPGTDTLQAYVGNSQNFAMLAESDGVERVVIQAQAVSYDSTDNNMSDINRVQIDAQKMVGIDYLEDNQSRADLIVEDLRLDFASHPHAITSDVTIAMVGTDPGHVDFGVYFDQHSLLAGASDSSQLALQLMDTRSYTTGGAPLKESPYFGFAFDLNGVHYQVGGTTSPGSLAIDAAQTYDDLLAAVKLAVSEVAGLKDVITVTFGPNFTVTDTLGSTTPAGKEIILTSTTGGSFSTTAANDGWIANGPVPPSSGLHTNMGTASQHFDDLITSKIILDDVGRTNMGGDLVVGGMSVGDTDDCKGVEKFLVTVIESSALQTLESTNNKLQEMYIVNNADATKGKLNGDLRVTGVVLSGAHQSGYSFASTMDQASVAKFDPAQLYLEANHPANHQVANETGINTSLPGAEVDVVRPANVTGDQHVPGYGLYDLRVLDASTFVGKLDLTAVMTDSVVAKYMDLKDIANDPAADQIAKPFVYTLGTNADKLDLNISQHNLEYAGSTTREDFNLTITGGTGDDKITTQIGNGSGVDGAAWYDNSKLNANLTIDAGADNDTVRTKGAGDWKINLGTGNDTLYADNSGVQQISVKGEDLALQTVSSKAMWVLNTEHNTANNVDQYISDLKSDGNHSHNTIWTPGALSNTVVTATSTSGLYKTSVTVHFEGFEKTIALKNTGYNTSDLQINQSIKEAINSDAVLSKMMVAQDGPGNTLVLTSLVDGWRAAENPDATTPVYAALGAGVQGDPLAASATAQDFHLTFQNVVQTALTQADVTGYAAAHGFSFLSGATLAEQQAAVFTAITDATTKLNNSTDYMTRNAVDSANVLITGAASANDADNKITAGTGDDVLVLGTGDHSNDTLIYSGINQGFDSVLNFTQGHLHTGVDQLTNTDYFDFSAYNSDFVAANLTQVAGSTNNNAWKSINLDDTGVAVAAGSTISATTQDTYTVSYQGVAAVHTDLTEANHNITIVNNNANLWYDIASAGNHVFDKDDIAAPAINTLVDQIFFVERVSANTNGMQDGSIDQGTGANNGVYDVYHYHATSATTVAAVVETVELIATIDFGYELGSHALI